MIMLSCSEVRFSLADIYTTPSKTAFFLGGGGRCILGGARCGLYHSANTYTLTLGCMAGQHVG